MYRIRKNGTVGNFYLKPDGTWGDWELAAKFETQSEAASFAKRYKIKNDYGLYKVKQRDNKIQDEEATSCPIANFWFEQLNEYSDVEERPIGPNSYYATIIDGVEGVISHNQKDQQKALDVMVKDTIMRRNNYVCKIEHKSIGEVLYFKKISQVGAFLREYYPKIKNVKTKMIIKEKVLA